MEAIKLVLFASIRERVGSAGETLPLPDEGHDVAALIEHLCKRGEPWRTVLADSRLLVAVNQEMADRTTPIKEGDEIAFFPPVTGG